LRDREARAGQHCEAVVEPVENGRTFNEACELIVNTHGFERSFEQEPLRPSLHHARLVRSADVE
jgi:hypothetical protein